MSVVTDIILAYPVLEPSDGGIDFELVQVDQHGGGNKQMQTNVYVGAFNHLDVEAFIQRVKDYPWLEPENVTLLVQKENDECFKMIHLR